MELREILAKNTRAEMARQYGQARIGDFAQATGRGYTSARELLKGDREWGSHDIELTARWLGQTPAQLITEQ